MDAPVRANNYFPTLTSEMARIDADRASWRKALAQTDIFAKQIRDFAHINSASEQIAEAMKALQSPAMTMKYWAKRALIPLAWPGSLYKHQQYQQSTPPP